MFGTTATGKGMFGGNGGFLGIQAPGGQPDHYPLDFYQHSITPRNTPLYHFRSDWDYIVATDAQTPIVLGQHVNELIVNFGSRDSTTLNHTNVPASIGDKVHKWSNAATTNWIPPELWLLEWEPERALAALNPGSARVAPPKSLEIVAPVGDRINMEGGNFWCSKGYPVLEEKTYTYTDGPQETFRGLRFNGASYLQLDGNEIVEYEDIFAGTPLFSTGGTEMMRGDYKKSGATFVFVIDADERIMSTNAKAFSPTENCCGFNEFDCEPEYCALAGQISPIQTLLYSRQPVIPLSPFGEYPLGKDTVYHWNHFPQGPWMTDMCLQGGGLAGPTGYIEDGFMCRSNNTPPRQRQGGEWSTPDLAQDWPWHKVLLIH